MDIFTDPAFIALLGTLFGGAGLKIIEHWLGKNKVKLDMASTIRNELRDDLAVQRKEIRELEKQVNDWQSKYFDMREEYLEIKSELIFALQKIKDEARDAEKNADRHDEKLE